MHLEGLVRFPPREPATSRLTPFQSFLYDSSAQSRSAYWQYLTLTKSPPHRLVFCWMKKPLLSWSLPVTTPDTFTSSPTLLEAKHSPVASAPGAAY